jgi:hypothetical protein
MDLLTQECSLFLACIDLVVSDTVEAETKVQCARGTVNKVHKGVNPNGCWTIFNSFLNEARPGGAYEWPGY